VYDMQMLKSAYPMAFFYVKVHLPTLLSEGGDRDQESDREYVYANFAAPSADVLISRVSCLAATSKTDLLQSALS
jgi:hypothetical protein